MEDELENREKSLISRNKRIRFISLSIFGMGGTFSILFFELNTIYIVVFTLALFSIYLLLSIKDITKESFIRYYPLVVIFFIGQIALLYNTVNPNFLRFYQVVIQIVLLILSISISYIFMLAMNILFVAEQTVRKSIPLRESAKGILFLINILNIYNITLFSISSEQRFYILPFIPLIFLYITYSYVRFILRREGDRFVKLLFISFIPSIFIALSLIGQVEIALWAFLVSVIWSGSIEVVDTERRVLSDSSVYITVFVSALTVVLSMII